MAHDRNPHLPAIGSPWTHAIKKRLWPRPLLNQAARPVRRRPLRKLLADLRKQSLQRWMNLSRYSRKRYRP